MKTRERAIVLVLTEREATSYNSIVVNSNDISNNWGYNVVSEGSFHKWKLVRIHLNVQPRLLYSSANGTGAHCGEVMNVVLV